jgi:uncharacterized membrane protein
MLFVMIAASFTILYLITYEPFEEPLMQKLELLNEVTSILLMYTISCFSSANVAGVANMLPIDITFLTLLGGNICVHLYFLLKDTYISVKEKCIKAKAKGFFCCKKTINARMRK